MKFINQNKENKAPENAPPKSDVKLKKEVDILDPYSAVRNYFYII